jgi:hypothetical protein
MFSVKSYSQLTGTVVSISGTVKNALTKEPLTVYVVAYTEDGKKSKCSTKQCIGQWLLFPNRLKTGCQIQNRY